MAKHQELGKFKDYNDLYDEDIQKIAKVWQLLMRDFSTKTMTQKNVDEMKKRAQDELFKIGIDGGITLDIMTGQFVLDLRGRIEGAPEFEHGFDHEKKQYEVITSRERSENFLGEKD